MTDWTKRPEKKETSDRVRIPIGLHKVGVKRLIHKVKGEPIESKGGDPQFLVVLSDTDGREVVERITLSEKAEWRLKEILFATKHDGEAMNKAGISLSDFAVAETAEAWIGKSEFWIKVLPDPKNPQYTRVKVLEEGHPDVERAEAAGATSVEAESATASTDDIPF